MISNLSPYIKKIYITNRNNLVKINYFLHGDFSLNIKPGYISLI